jgi:hypothetical protein
MNEDRATLINLVLEERLSPADGVKLMEKMNDLDAASPANPATLLPDFPDPIVDNYEALFTRGGCPDLLTQMPRRMARGLKTGDVKLAITSLAMLDVAALADFWTTEDRMGWMFGAGQLHEREGGFRLKNCALHFSGESLAMRLFWHSIPPRRPEATFSLILEEGENRVEYTVYAEPESTVTRAGRYEECVKVTHRLSRYHLPEEVMLGDRFNFTVEYRTFWLAPGVGPVRALYQRAGETIFNVELTEAHVAPSDELFPQETGNWWRFEGTSFGHPHRELWRSLAPDENRLHWFTVAAFPYTEEEDLPDEDE